MTWLWGLQFCKRFQVFEDEEAENIEPFVMATFENVLFLVWQHTKS